MNLAEGPNITLITPPLFRDDFSWKIGKKHDITIRAHLFQTKISEGFDITLIPLPPFISGKNAKGGGELVWHQRYLDPFFEIYTTALSTPKFLHIQAYWTAASLEYRHFAIFCGNTYFKCIYVEVFPLSGAYTNLSRSRAPKNLTCSQTPKSPRGVGLFFFVFFASQVCNKWKKPNPPRAFHENPLYFTEFVRLYWTRFDLIWLDSIWLDLSCLSQTDYTRPS